MPRNKIVKRTYTLQTNNQPSLQKSENDFLATPAKLAGQLTKEITSLKQKETKLKKEIHKSNSQIKDAENRIKLSLKIKTPAGKKQLNIAKKSFKEIMKNHAGLNKQYVEITKTLEKSANKQAKFLALGKYLKQFDKEWAKNLKNKVQSKVQRKKAKAQPVISSIQERPQSMETSEVTLENVRLPETTEELVS